MASAAIQIVARCTRGGSWFQPKIQTPEERRLDHERGQALDRQRGAEHAADEVRVRRPAHPELELLHQAGRHADREVDQQQRAEEAREA